MIEKHFAYKITKDPSGLVCTQFEFEEDKMLNLLKEISETKTEGIYWIFKQVNGKPKQALCIIDCEQGRIYYHYSGEVDTVKETILKLSQKNNPKFGS
jgi:hypothetical protein